MRNTELLDLLTEPYPLLRIRSGSDQLPNGLAAAMVPLVVDWRRSRLAGDPEDYYLVRNVNVGGNPVAGRSVLATVKVPRFAVTEAEWVLVILRLMGKDISAGHGQVRLRFAPGNGPVVLNREGGPMWPDPHLEDLVFSFEAWRPPGTPFQPLAGLDPRTYALTLRCYDGAQRFLEDGVSNHAWTCYPLDLSGRPGALDELLYTALVAGDSLARHMASHFLGDPGVNLLLEQPDYPSASPREIEKLRTLLEMDRIPDDPIAEITGGDVSYHLLQRSCITMGLSLINSCLHRIHHRHAELGKFESLSVAPREIPDWAAARAHADRRATLMRLPGALHWLAVNQNVLPDKSYAVLEKAGLLRRSPNGQLVRRRYALDDATPYGRIGDTLMQ